MHGKNFLSKWENYKRRWGPSNQPQKSPVICNFWGENQFFFKKTKFCRLNTNTQINSSNNTTTNNSNNNSNDLIWSKL